MKTKNFFLTLHNIIHRRIANLETHKTVWIVWIVILFLS